MNARINKIVSGATALVALVPSLVLASDPPVSQGASTQNGIGGVLSTVSNLIGLLIPIILALAVVWFMWGVLQYVTKGGDAAGQKEARDTMLWGIIAIAVMVSIWGLVGILQSTFGLQNAQVP